MPVWIAITFGCIQMAFNAVISVTLLKANFWKQDLTELKTSLREATTELVEQRYATFATTLAAFSQRLESGDGTFEKLGIKNQSLELRLKDQTHEITEWTRTNMASADALRQHESAVERRLGKVDEHILKLIETVAAMSAKLEQKGKGHANS